MFSISAIFVGLGIFIFRDGKLAGLLCAIFFGIGMVVAPLHYWSAQLKLTTDGMLIKNFVREDYYEWQEVDSFAVVTIGLNHMVGFNFTDQLKKEMRGRELAKKISGREAALPDNYGMDPMELVMLIMKYKTVSQKLADKPPQT